MAKHHVIQRLLDPGLIAILRADSATGLVEATTALAAGGVIAAEVTLTTPNALEVIRDSIAALGDAIVMGAGSVLDAESCRAALLAGAQFIVTPTVRPEVITMCHRYGVPVACGAMTPTEALTAQELGADFIKLFPAELLGPAAVKAFLAPLPMLQIIPTGGVTPENVGEYLDAGAAALGAGSQLVSRQNLEKKDWSAITKLAERYVAAVKKARGQ
jgi:2-dehydro-3-deoxyphosphogluconate aldolase/(4S)-4-hydroxy-2-oxoglutarate aldolase